MPDAIWPPHWRDVVDPVEAVSLVEELGRELPDGHVLAGRRVYAMARRDDGDNVLFAFDDGGVAHVHLTWTREVDPDFPWTRIFRNADVWRDQLKGD